MTGVLVRDVTWGDGRADLRCTGDRITTIARGLTPLPGEEVVSGAEAVVPGLHDHHLHLLAMAAHRDSVDLGPDRVTGRAEVARLLGQADASAGDGAWIRAVGYDERAAGRLDRWALDKMVVDRPLRVQDRTGHLWVLNSAACTLVGLDADGPDGAERADGVATGRLVDGDDWLGGRLVADRPPVLAAVGTRLASFGVTGVTDATPFDHVDDIAPLAGAVASGDLPQRVVVTGGPGLAGAPLPARLVSGPVKMMVGDATYPSVDELASWMAGAHGHGRSVALHCASRIAAVLALAAWEAVGSRPGDRMEHGSVLPPEVVARLADLGITVVTQPGFLYDRGDRYLAEVEPADLSHLYRCASLEAAGLGVGGGTDAPFGPDDPWVAMRSAVERRTRAGAVVGADERVTPARALQLFLSDPAAPGGPPRLIGEGGPGDLVLLDCTVGEALADLDAGHVVATVAAGRVVHRS